MTKKQIVHPPQNVDPQKYADISKTERGESWTSPTQSGLGKYIAALPKLWTCGQTQSVKVSI